MNKDHENPKEFTEQEQEQRDKLLRKLLTTPPKPREAMKKGKEAKPGAKGKL
jgi:hypothetical protein